MYNNFLKILLIVSIIFFIASSMIFWYFFREIKNNQSETYQLETTWRVEMSKREELKELDNSIKIIEAEISQLESHFAKNSDIVPFLNTIEGLAPKTGARAKVMAVNLVGEQKELAVTLEASGSFDSIYKFIKLLENSPYELEFTALNILQRGGSSPNTEEQRAPEWEALISMKLLSFVN